MLIDAVFKQSNINVQQWNCLILIIGLPSHQATLPSLATHHGDIPDSPCTLAFVEFLSNTLNLHAIKTGIIIVFWYVHFFLWCERLLNQFEEKFHSKLLSNFNPVLIVSIMKTYIMHELNA